jgi:hypothetical protein
MEGILTVKSTPETKLIWSEETVHVNPVIKHLVLC